MKCDLHVHTVHSGMCTVPLLNRICRESYSSAQYVYETLKRCGMDLVTVTDHDSISARDRREFMEGLKRGQGTAIGDSGDYIKLTRAVGEIGFELLKENPWTALLAPLMAAIPLVTLAHLALETVFAHTWGRRMAVLLDAVPPQRDLERV